MKTKEISKAGNGSKAKAVLQSMAEEGMSAKEKRQCKKAADQIEGTVHAFLTVLNFGRTFQRDEDVAGLTGYSLAFAMTAAAKQISETLEAVDTPDNAAGRKAAVHLGEAKETIDDMAQIAEELSHSSDDWGGFGMAVGTMVYAMGLTAAREAELAMIALTGNGVWGFTDPNYRYTR